MDIKSLRAMRGNDLSKIAEQFDQANSPQGEKKDYKDDRFWKPERDKAGNASATIRFLSRTEGDDLPWVKIFSHGFQGPGGRWYIENSLTTLGQADPVSELNTQLWNSTTDDNSPARKQARAQKRKLSYIANILVINDPKHPENNGKVFLFKFGKKIFDMIMDKARPAFDDEDPVNVFDYWEGANFKLRMKTVDRFPNYDSSTWEDVGPVADSDEEILEIAKQQHRLGEFLEPAAFKTYDELKRKLEQVLNATSVGTTAAQMAEDDDTPPVAAPRKIASKPAPAPKAKAATAEDDDDALSYFQSIADED